MSAWRDADIQALATKTAFSAQQWSDAHLFVRDEFPAQHHDTIWLFLIHGAPGLHQRPLSLARALRSVYEPAVTIRDNTVRHRSD